MKMHHLKSRKIKSIKEKYLKISLRPGLILNQAKNIFSENSNSVLSKVYLLFNILKDGANMMI